VLAQSHSDFELLVVDDASSGETSQLVGEFTDPRIRYFRQERNVGVAENWGSGLQLARGTFVAWLMDDDRYEPTFLAARVRALAANPRAAFAFSGYRIVDERTQSVVETMTPRTARDSVLTNAAAFRAALFHDVFIGATLYRTSIARETWPLVTSYGEIVDYALNVRMTMHPDAEAMLIEPPDFLMSSHPDQLSQQRRDKAFRLTAEFLNEIQVAGTLPVRDASALRGERSAWQLEWAKYDRICGRRGRGWAKWLRAVRANPISLLPARTAVSWLLEDLKLRITGAAATTPKEYPETAP